MRAAIYGAGAMGTVLGAFLTAAGVPVDMISRNRAHIEALKRDGARVTGGAEFTIGVRAMTPEEMTGAYDVIFLMTKQRENAAVCAFLRGFLADGGVICTMQNGLPEPAVARQVGEERCLGCAVSWGATRIADGVAQLTSARRKMTFAVGSIFGRNEKTETVCNILSHAGRATAEENFIGARWAKLAVNSAFSSLSAATGMTFGEVAKFRSTRKLALTLLGEAFAVAKGCGIRVEKIQGHDLAAFCCGDSAIKRAAASAFLPFAMKSHKNIVSGMAYDLKAGKRCEIDLINGVVARAGKMFGVETPVNDRVLSLVCGIERGEREVCKENAQILLV